ncbi:MAG: hypothetical protein SOW48_00195 [Peptoniphilaceae bacterium]|nr:hypothetical protein [Peptoniphilaceae bacterium]MDY3075073.1 hypothetical protein [Peptoniphilaceae bacterium]
MPANKKTVLCERLSRTDEMAGDSNSIINQKKMLKDYANKNGCTNILHLDDALNFYCDYICVFFAMDLNDGSDFYIFLFSKGEHCCDHPNLQSHRFRS